MIPPLFNPEDAPFIRQSIIDGIALYIAWSLMWYLRGRNNWVKKLLMQKKQIEPQN